MASTILVVFPQTHSALLRLKRLQILESIKRANKISLRLSLRLNDHSTLWYEIPPHVSITFLQTVQRWMGADDGIVGEENAYLVGFANAC